MAGENGDQEKNRGTRIDGGIPAELSWPAPQPVRLRADRALLVVVDMEKEFLHPRGRLYLGAEAPSVIAAVASLIEQFRRRRAPVVYLRSVRTPDAPEHTVFGRPLHLLEGTWAVEFVEPIRPGPDEPVVEKRSHDGFNHTRLEETVAGLGIAAPHGQVVVAGVAANVCVHAAVVGFSVRNFHVALPMDATLGDDRLAEWAAYRHLSAPAYRYNVALTDLAHLAWE